MTPSGTVRDIAGAVRGGGTTPDSSRIDPVQHRELAPV